MPVMGVAKFEQFFRDVAGLDVDKADLKLDDFINQKIYDLLVRAQGAAKANVRDIIEPYDLPITLGLRKCIQEFGRYDQQIELKSILDEITARPPLDLAYSVETEAQLPEIAGGLSVALAHAFTILDTKLKNPSRASIGSARFVSSRPCSNKKGRSRRPPFFRALRY
jgi:hypothetical protein